MKLTNLAKEKLLEHLAEDGSAVPGIAWVCDEGYSDPIKEGYWQFGFYDASRLKSRTSKQFLSDVDGVMFALDVPDLLRKELSKLCLDFVDAGFVVRAE